MSTQDEDWAGKAQQLVDPQQAEADIGARADVLSMPLTPKKPGKTSGADKSQATPQERAGFGKDHP